MSYLCPHCNTRVEIEQATEDANTRALHALLAGRPAVGGYVVAYLGLFKPRLQGLRPSRSLYLAHEVLDLTTDDARLAAALVETVEAFREKRQAPEWKPLGNHRYLQRVLESVSARPLATAPAGRSAGPQSRTAQAIDAVQAVATPDGVPEALAQAIRGAFTTWLQRSMEGQPAADLVARLAHDWMTDLAGRRTWDGRNLHRLEHGIRKIADSAGRWPRLNDLLAYVPTV